MAGAETNIVYRDLTPLWLGIQVPQPLQISQLSAKPSVSGPYATARPMRSTGDIGPFGLEADTGAGYAVDMAYPLEWSDAHRRDEVRPRRDEARAC